MAFLALALVLRALLQMLKKEHVWGAKMAVMFVTSLIRLSVSNAKTDYSCIKDSVYLIAQHFIRLTL